MKLVPEMIDLSESIDKILNVENPEQWGLNLTEMNVSLE
jgi:hypothetical protein